MEPINFISTLLPNDSYRIKGPSFDSLILETDLPLLLSASIIGDNLTVRVFKYNKDVKD